jgi:hypothetical protein
MSDTPSQPAGNLPRWIVPVGSVVIIVHLLAVGTAVLSAQSGPWFVPQMGPSPALPPKFAEVIHEVTGPNYLQHVKLAHTYHFASNRPNQPGVKLEARLKFADGRTRTVEIPDKDANPWVRHRQVLLLQGLADDMPIPPQPTESIPAAGQKVVEVKYWDSTPTDRTLRLVTKPEHLIPRNREVSRPSDWALLLAQSYGRYLCRAHGAESVELIRHTKGPFPPEVLLLDRERAQQFNPELIASFGEISK